MSDELIVNVPAITIAAARVHSVVASIADQTFDANLRSGMGDAAVQSASDDFAQTWDNVLGGLTSVIEGLRESMGTAVETYQELDDLLARPGGPPVAK